MMEINNLIYKHLNNEYLENPIGAMLCITSKCNLHCKHCYNESGIADDIDDSNWIHLTEDILHYKSIKCVSISGGEPLLRFKLLKRILLKLSENPKIRVLITTNGYFVTKDFVTFLTYLPNTIELQFSLDGHNNIINFYTRNNLNSFNETVNGIRRCIGFKNIVVSTNCSLNKYNIQYVDNYLTLMANLKINSVMLTPVVSIGRAAETTNYLLSSYERLEFVRNVKFYKDKYPKLNITIGSPGGIYDLLYYVSHPIDWLIVTSNGDVKLSIRYPYIIGTIQKDNIHDLWKKINCKQKSADIIDNMIERLVEQEGKNVKLFK